MSAVTRSARQRQRDFHRSRRVHLAAGTRSRSGRSANADPLYRTAATSLQPCRRQPLHERPRRAGRTDALHCVRQGRWPAVRQTLAETQSTAADHERCRVMPAEAAAALVLQRAENACPCRIDVPHLHPGPARLALDRIAHLARPETRQHVRETLAVGTQPRLRVAQIEVLNDDGPAHCAGAGCTGASAWLLANQLATHSAASELPPL